MKSVKVIKQHDRKDCGAASLCMISSYFGKEHSLRFMRGITHTGQNGVSMQGLSEGAERIGIASDAWQADAGELVSYLEKEKKPVILHMVNNHFVVAWLAKGSKIWLADPAVGKYHLAREKFEKLWSGYFMTFEDQGPKKDEKEEKVAAFPFKDIVTKNWKGLCYILILSCVLVGASLCMPYLFQVLMNYGDAIANANVHDEQNLIVRTLSFIASHGEVKLLLFMIALTAVMALVTYFKGRASAILARKMDVELMDQYSSKLFRTKISELSTRMTGDYASRAADLVIYRSMMTEVFVSFLINVSLFLVGSILLIRINPWLYAVSMVTLLLYTLLVLALRKRFEVATHATMSANAEVRTYLKEAIQGMELIKANHAEKDVQARLMEKYESLKNRAYRGNILGSYSVSVSTLIEQLSNVIVIFAGFEFVEQRVMSLGELMSFFMLTSLFLDSAKQLVSMQQDFQSGLVSADRLNDVRYLDEEAEGDIRLDQVSEIRLDHVGFSFFDRPELFSDVSFTLNGQTKMVLIGENGCGKSTLLRIIIGMEKAASGKVFVNGTSIENIHVQDLRERVAYVTQNPFLFADTLFYNLTLGRERKMEEILEACEMAGLGDFLRETPQGLGLFIDENAVNLSSGQKQSIAIARALLRKPDVLILDEATSNMDPAREEAVITRLMNMDVPCIFVTHNRDVMKKADIVVELGRNVR